MTNNGKSIEYNENCLNLITKLQSKKSFRSIWDLYKITIEEIIDFNNLSILIKDSSSEKIFTFKKNTISDCNKSLSFSISSENILLTINLTGCDSSIRKTLKKLTKIFLKHHVFLKKLKDSKNLNIKDEITGIYNQKYLKEVINKEVEKNKRYKQFFSVVFFDLDGLRTINEKHGHITGTKVLIELANFLRKHLRKSDIIARFGGDEFVFILFNTNKSQAILVCNRIKESLLNHVFLKKEGLRIKLTGSFGISIFPDHGNTTEDLIRNADKAMYEIKKQGKNGIKLYGG